ncbi:hypothetical protein phiOC_p372 [Ochrobactrum phage vB_OspM_OC]|nr:hypothetical protein phiOC_p372 [Ochrobactrum phage vB_OspM_OC]
MKYVVANTIYEGCNGTNVGIYEVSEEQMEEIRQNHEHGWLEEENLSFEFDDLVEVKAPVTGTIEMVLTFYYPD